MISNPSFFSHSYYKKPLNQYANNYTNRYFTNPYGNYSMSYPNNHYKHCNEYQINSHNQSQLKFNNQYKEDVKKKDKECSEPEIFEIFGIKLYFDDILLICLIFFLYNEGVKDQYLFISLILLLLS